MALFQDGPPANIDDLSGQDTQLLEVANTEGIDVTRKLALAQEEIAVELDGLLSRLRGFPASLESVVVTRPLRVWHTFRTLEMVYRDAYHNQLNDRYAAKRDQFHGMAKWAYEKLLDSGIGMTTDPMPRAATPEVATAPGNLPAGTYYVSMSWVNQSSEEGACAVAAAAAVAGGTIRVTPEAGPKNATGWNVYVGTSPDGMTRQNQRPVGMAETWLQPDALLTGGVKAGDGQAANYVRPAPRVIQRG